MQVRNGLMGARNVTRARIGVSNRAAVGGGSGRRWRLLPVGFRSSTHRGAAEGDRAASWHDRGLALHPIREDHSALRRGIVPKLHSDIDRR
jgi:hypothetical protein